MVAFLEQENVTQHGISIPPQSCLQRRRRPVTSTDIDPPQARKYHAILKYSRGRWPTVSSPFSTLMAYLSNWLCNSGQCLLQLLSQFCLAIARQVTETVLCVIPAKLLKTSGCFWCPVFHLPIRSNARMYVEIILTGISFWPTTAMLIKNLWNMQHQFSTPNFCF